MSVNSVQVHVIVISNFLIRIALILKGVEKRVSMHVDVRLLPEEALSVSFETIWQGRVVIIL